MNYTEIREIYSRGDGYISGTILAKIKKGESLRYGRDQVATCVIDGNKRKTFALSNGSRATARKTVKDGNTIAYFGEGLWRQLSSDVEADITVDLINEYNPFHEPSQSMKILREL